MNTIILNGQNSNQITGLLIQELPPISKPMIRTEMETIDGRDGDITTKLGYSAYDKTITIGLHGNYDINKIIAYFNSEGTVVFSNEPDKYYKYQILEQIDFERLVRYRTATVKLHCQPFKYSLEEAPKILSYQNLLDIPDQVITANGVTVTVHSESIEVLGNATETTEIYMPITALSLDAGSYTLEAFANGINPEACSIRLTPSNSSTNNSFGNSYATLVNEQEETITATISSTTTYNYLYLLFQPNIDMEFDLGVDLFNNTSRNISASGSHISLDNTAETKFSNFSIYGNSEQDSYSGKNLLSVVERVGVSNGITSTMFEGEIHSVGTITSTWSIISGYGEVDLPAGEYTFSLRTPISCGFGIHFVYEDNTAYEPTMGSGQVKKTITLSKRATRVYLIITSTNNTKIDARICAMLEAGSTASDYEPYTGLVKAPNPLYPQTIKNATTNQQISIFGKNMLTDAIKGNVNWSGTNVAYDGDEIIVTKTGTGGISAAPHTTIQYTPLKQGHTYTFSIKYRSGKIIPYGNEGWRIILYVIFPDGTWSSADYARLWVNIPANTSTPPVASVTLTATQDFIGFRLGCYIPGNTPKTDGDVYFDCQLEENQVGQNLFDKTTATAGYRIGSDGVPYADTPYSVSDFISIDPKTAYRYSRGGTSTNSAAIAYYDSSKTFISRTMPIIGDNAYSGVLTSPTNAVYARIADITTLIDTMQYVAEKNATYSDFEPYAGQNYKIGKNLFDKTTITAGYRIGADGQPYAGSGFSLSDYIPVKELTIYSYSRSGETSYDSAAAIAYYDSSKAFISRAMPIIPTTADSGVLTSPANAVYARIADKVNVNTMQLEFGRPASNYSAHYTPVELCAIDDHKDYFYPSGDDWYIHKEIDKKIYNGSTGTLSSPSTNRFNIDNFITTYKKETGSVLSRCDYYRNFGQTGDNASFNTLVANESYAMNLGSGTYYNVRIKDTRFTSADDFRTWASENPITIYYVLETPTDTKITDETLKSELDATLRAYAYLHKTNIDVLCSSSDSPFIITAEVLANLSDMLTNHGNIYARPKLFIKGEGDISIKLNGVQIFQIALGNEEHITIDTEAMEAYKDSPENLKNRLVTGDYSKFRLIPGENHLSFTGDVTDCVVENYSRWL